MNATESVMRDALLCAFLEGGSWTWERFKSDIPITPEQAATAADDYVCRALPNVMAGIAAEAAGEAA